MNYAIFAGDAISLGFFGWSLVRLDRTCRPRDRDRIPWRDLRATDDWRRR
jgi:hypothetical protein